MNVFGAGRDAKFIVDRIAEPSTNPRTERAIGTASA
jgi:hypothetical protein